MSSNMGGNRLQRYRGKGERATREIVRYVAQRFPEVMNNRALWLKKSQERAMVVSGMKPGSSIVEWEANLAHGLLPSPESMLHLMRELEKEGAVSPPNPDIKMFHEKQRMAANKGPSLCESCGGRVKPKVRRKRRKAA